MSQVTMNKAEFQGQFLNFYWQIEKGNLYAWNPPQ